MKPTANDIINADRVFDLTGKTAIVTGGAGIQGVRICRGLAAFGASVAVIDIAADSAERLADEVADEYGVRTLGIGCDVSDPNAVAEMVQKVVAEFRHVDILHNNAATKTRDVEAFFAPFEDYALNTWREIMSVNIDGMFLVAQAVGRAMVEQGRGGSIIQTASTYGVVAPDQRIYRDAAYGGRTMNTPAVYSVSKAAVIGLTRYLATYWADHKIRVNALTPGGVTDPRSEVNEQFVQSYTSRVPLGRMAMADDMVGAVVYLASDASNYVTGHNLVVDGGWTVW